MTRRWIHSALGCGLLVCLTLPAAAQTSNGLTGGFAGRAAATVSGEELIGQTNLWVLEVEFKPMRMISVEVTDPRTDEKSQEWIWYMVYRAVNRPIDRRVDDTDIIPQNDFDVQPQPPLFVPEFTLVAAKDEGGETQIIPDSVVPEAEPAIDARENRGRDKSKPLKNSVDIVQPIPEPATTDEPAAENVIRGVAIWRGVDPETDYFTVFMEGFSNGYRVGKGPDGKPLVERRMIVQQFWRPGDEFEEQEREIRLKGEARWLYRADAPKTTAAVEPPAKAEPPAAAAEPKE